MPKKKILKAWWIIPLIAILILGALFSLLILLPEKKIICGDGVCDETETAFCTLDCESNCINTTMVATKGTEIESCSRGWKSAYFDVLIERNISTDYLRETEQIDYSHPIIQSLAKQLKKETAKETAKAIALWTFNNIRYDSANDFNDCKNVKASEIIERGYGICSTQSKVNLALLRANGIPARTVTGCFTYSVACRRIQTIFRRRVPTIFPVEVDASGFVSTRGGLHNWAEILIPTEEDWTILESTVGLLYDAVCINYKTYLRSEEDITPDSPEVCGLLPSNPFVQDCRDWEGD